MGVPKFFRYISERYPCILEQITENQIPEFDNMYLDMNGILHKCSHPKEQDIMQNISEKDIFDSIFHYVDVLFYIIRPKKLLFLAVDGVAPRAKMNQQRSRRFRVAKEREMLENKMKSEGKKLSDTPGFDSNCITPGTEFMIRLQNQLEYYVASRISTNPLWQTCKVILSGHKVPGEGEHKIVEYIRYMKGLPDYDPNLRHCMYGLDMDLVILGLCTHERNFSILREEVNFGRKSATVLPPEQTKFYLLHLCLLKEYLDLEFEVLKLTLPFEYDLEKIIDDWVLMGFILGNDFIPHLPDFHITKGALPVLYKAYMEVLPTLGGYLNEDGHLNLPRFQAFMEALAKHELKSFEETYADLQYFGEKTGKKLGSEKNKDDCDKLQDIDLDKLPEAIDELNIFDYDTAYDYSDPEEEPDDEDDEDLFLQEFYQHKKDYYVNKLEYSEVTGEILQSQAEGYVRGLQWILHYYYHGCPSWSWYYPHHYAPCTSDVVNFKDVNMDFELGEPFLPYQQLLAVLPPASKDLVPKAYRNLMVSPDSPIIEYYPNNFETDLNGKQHDWEAIVLLPIIDEVILLNAMKDYDNNLTEAEKQNNKHGPMLFYSYTSENLGFYKAPQYFPDIPSNHALTETVWKDAITSVSDKLTMKNTKKEDLDMFFPGFPTLKYLRFEAATKKAKVRIFNYATTSDSIVLTIISPEEQPDTEELASELLDKTVYVKWPFLTEARVAAVGDMEFLYFLSNKTLDKKKHSATEKREWSNKSSYWTRLYMEKFGINIGIVKVLVYAKTLKGTIFKSGGHAQLNPVKVWSENVELYPLQTIIKDMKIFEAPAVISKPEDIFSVDSIVFTLTSLYYGSMGKIVKRLDQARNRVKVEVEVSPEHNIDKELLSQSKTSYHTPFVAGQLIGISQAIISMISGTILVDLMNPGEILEKKKVVNIGLGIKFNKSQEEIPGYTKKGSCWLYSNKAIDVMKEYVTTYPNIVKYLYNRTRETYVAQRQEIFPDPDGAQEIQKLLDWKSNLECSKIKRVPCGSQILEKDVILKLEEMIDNSPKSSSFACIIAKTDELFKSDLSTSGLPPVPKAEHRLLDRVISVKPYYSVPQGLRGYIIGINNNQYSQDIMYDILYDTPFPAGLALNCSPGRGFKTSDTSFINISYGERLHQLWKPRKINRTTASVTVKSPRLLVRESPSAFSQWNVNSPAVPIPEKNIPYKDMWSLLEMDKSQDETNILKKMLKIEEDHKPKIEENVKNFFETLSKNPEIFMPTINNAMKMPTSHISEAKNSLLQFFKIRKMPPPKIIFNSEGRNRVICKIQLHNQKEFTGFPSINEEKALESAAAVVFSYFASPNKDIEKFFENITGKNQKLMEYHDKPQESSSADNELYPKLRNPELGKSNVNPRGIGDKSNSGNKSFQQCQRKNNAPKVLPTPPPQWCRQYKNPHKGQDKYFHLNEHKLKSDSRKVDHSGRQRFHNDNQNFDRSRMDMPCSSRSSGWKQQDKRMRNLQTDNRLGNDLPFPHFNLNNRWPRPIQGEMSQSVNFKPDICHLRQENGNSQALPLNSEVGSSNSSQKLSAIATEFIPLQALTRNRQRRPTATTSIVAPVQGTSFRKETPQKEASASPNPVEPPVDAPKENHSSLQRSRRKSKIAAKFDGAWDLPG